MPITQEAVRNTTGAVGTTSPVISPLHDKRLQVGLSTQIIIEAQDSKGQFRAIGACQSVTPSEDRTLTRIGEIGTDAVIEIVPTTFTSIQLDVTRMVFDYQRLPAAMQRGFRHISAQRIPFDIQITDYNPYQEIAGAAGGIPNAVVTRYVNCWIQRYSTEIRVDNYILSETATIWAEHVFDFTTGSEPIAVGGDDLSERSNNDSPASNTLSEAFVVPPAPGSSP
jgi:hypothetical protein